MTMVNKKIGMAEIKLTESEIAAAERVLRSGALRQGRECEAFEREFADKVGSRYAVTCSSGTAALHLSYMAFLKPGDEVLVPSFTFIAAASTVTAVGAKPVFCDVDPETFLLDLEDAKSRLTPRTRAIAPVHLFGNVCDIDAVNSFALSHNLAVVWDAAQAHGARYRGNGIGSAGGFVCYSFYPSKNMFVGEGGITCTDNEEYCDKIRFLRTHGQTGPYLHTMIGLNYRMTDVEAAIGREQLKRLDELIAVRRRNASILNEAFAEVKGISPQKVTPDTEHAWHQYCIVVDSDTFGCDRNALADHLKRLGIDTGVHYPRGLHQQPIFQEMYGKTELMNSERIAENILAIPVHHGLSEIDVYRIADAVRSCNG
jgi:perosamine synthetase